MPGAQTRRGRRYEADIKTIRRLWLAGFALLPLLWFAAWVNFRKKAQRRDCPQTLSDYYRKCQIGSIVAAVLFVAWIVVFQLSWRTVPGFASLLVVPAESIGGVDPW